MVCEGIFFAPQTIFSLLTDYQPHFDVPHEVQIRHPS